MFGAARRCGPAANVYSARVSGVTSGAGLVCGGPEGGGGSAGNEAAAAGHFLFLS